MVSDKKIFHVFHYIGLCKTCDPRGGAFFWPQGHYLNKLGSGPPGESGVWSPLDSLDGQNMVLRDEIARPHCTRIIEEYKNQQNIASLPRPSLLPDMNPIEHMWDKLG